MAMKKIEMVFFLFIFLLIPVVMSQGAPPAASWWGTVSINGNTSTNGAVVEAFINNVIKSNTTVGAYTSGYYLINVGCTEGQNVTIKVYGVEANQSGRACSQGASTELNLTMNKTANGVTCTYAGGCTSGFCVDGYCCNEACSGASEDCNVAGHEGTCTSTATTTTVSGGGGGGGGGGGVTNTTTTKITTTTAIAPKTTTILPKTTTTARLTTTTIKKPKPKTLEIAQIPTVQVIGIIVGVVVILALVSFIFIRFQVAKTTDL